MLIELRVWSKCALEWIKFKNNSDQLFVREVWAYSGNLHSTKVEVFFLGRIIMVYFVRILLIWVSLKNEITRPTVPRPFRKSYMLACARLQSIKIFVQLKTHIYIRTANIEKVSIVKNHSTNLFFAVQLQTSIHDQSDWRIFQTVKWAKPICFSSRAQ